MKAATIARYGSPGVIEVRDVPAPAPGPEEVLGGSACMAIETLTQDLRHAIRTLRGFVLLIACAPARQHRGWLSDTRRFQWHVKPRLAAAEKSA